jgi:hypothetical protein
MKQFLILALAFAALGILPNASAAQEERTAVP